MQQFVFFPIFFFFVHTYLDVFMYVRISLLASFSHPICLSVCRNSIIITFMCVCVCVCSFYSSIHRSAFRMTKANLFFLIHIYIEWLFIFCFLSIFTRYGMENNSKFRPNVVSVCVRVKPKSEN